MLQLDVEIVIFSFGNAQKGVVMLWFAWFWSI
jgi:hypothetical protein